MAIASDPALADSAAAMCAPVDRMNRGSGARAVPIADTTTTIWIVRDGDPEPPLSEVSGRRLDDVEIAVKLGQDGRVVACRVVRQYLDIGPAQPDEACRQAMEEPPAFVAAGPDKSRGADGSGSGGSTAGAEGQKSTLS